MSFGFRILSRPRKVSTELVDRFRDLPVANVSDNMSRITASGTRIRPMHAGGVLAGPALTVKSRPGDNLMLHKALDMAEPGDVVVMDAGGDLTNSLIGELMVTYAMRRQLAGVVLNGAIRDFSTIRQGSFPVYAAGVTHRGPYKDGPGEINVPIAIDGMVIEPGDLVLGDEDGLVCVPQAVAEDVYRRAKEKHDAEVSQMAEIREGRWDRSWVDAALQRLGCDVRGA